MLSLSLSLAARYIFHVVDRWIYRFDVFLITRKHFRLIFLATITIHLSITSISCFRFAFKLKFLAFYGEAYNRIFNFSRDFELVDIASSFQNIKNNKIRATDACLVWKGSWSSALVSFSHRSCFISTRGSWQRRFTIWRTIGVEKRTEDFSFESKKNLKTNWITIWNDFQEWIPRSNLYRETPINNKKEGKRVPCVNRASHAVIVGRF